MHICTIFTIFAESLNPIPHHSMISFFKNVSGTIIAVESDHKLEKSEIEKLTWLFSDAENLDSDVVEGHFVGPRREMITPWSTNAVEITQNMGLSGIQESEMMRKALKCLTN